MKFCSLVFELKFVLKIDRQTFSKKQSNCAQDIRKCVKSIKNRKSEIIPNAMFFMNELEHNKKAQNCCYVTASKNKKKDDSCTSIVDLKK